jgi:hypothetical protein
MVGGVTFAPFTPASGEESSVECEKGDDAEELVHCVWWKSMIVGQE